MFKAWKRFKRDLMLAVLGFQEAVISIADHVNLYIQKVVMNMESAELGNELRGSLEYLGKKFYERKDSLFDQGTEDMDIQDALEKIKEIQKKLEAMEGFVSPYEALHDFERVLIRSDFVIQHVMILEGFHGIGKTIQELEFPSQMLIFFVKKRNQDIDIAYGKVVIETRDEITFLCAKENIEKYIAFWK
ncbi:MAG: hypothetical protein ACE5GK_04310 [Nitrospiria bacterium]